MAEAIPTGTEVSPCSTVAAFTTQNVQPGFRSTSSAMASIPRFFAKIASLGYIGTEIETVASVLPQPAEALATNANSIDNALIDATFGNGTTDSPSVGGAAFEGGVRGVGSVFAYVTSKWAVLCLFMVEYSDPISCPFIDLLLPLDCSPQPYFDIRVLTTSNPATVQNSPFYAYSSNIDARIPDIPDCVSDAVPIFPDFPRRKKCCGNIRSLGFLLPRHQQSWLMVVR
jgi:hypothetical protein